MAAETASAPVAPEPLLASSGVAVQRAPEEEPRTFPCEECGADLRFSIAQQSLECPYCGFVKQIQVEPGAAVEEQDLGATLRRLAEQRDERGRDPGELEVKCGGCGATVTFSGTLTATECSFCGTPIQREDARAGEHRVPVDAVLPFAVPRQQARRNLRAWVQARWFAPSEFKRRGAQGRFAGVYLPFWTYDAMTSTAYEGERGEHYWVEVGSGENRRRERRTRWYHASGSFARFFDDVLVCAARRLDRRLVDALEPWPLAGAKPFAAELLAGYQARTYDLGLEEGFGEARALMENAIATEVRRRIGGDEQRVHRVNTRFGGLTYKHLLLPAWMLAYRFHGKSYRVLVNACTGEVQGRRPWSWAKITAAVLALLAVVGGVAAYFANGG